MPMPVAGEDVAIVLSPKDVAIVLSPNDVAIALPPNGVPESEMAVELWLPPMLRTFVFDSGLLLQVKGFESLKVLLPKDA